MTGTRRITLAERDAVEGGVRCPGCGKFTTFADIIATGCCRDGDRRGGDCDINLSLELVVTE